MIRFRIRRWGWDDWTLLTFEGELADICLQVLVSRLLENHDVQQLNEDGEWEEFE